MSSYLCQQPSGRVNLMLRRLGILIVALSVFAELGSRGPFAQAADLSDSSEYLIKAGFIYNFAKFRRLASDCFLPSRNSPIVIGILGIDPFGAPHRPGRPKQENRGRGVLS